MKYVLWEAMSALLTMLTAKKCEIDFVKGNVGFVDKVDCIKRVKLISYCLSFLENTFFLINESYKPDISLSGSC